MVKGVKNGPLTRPHRTKMKTDNERRLRKNLLGILLLLPYIALLWLPFYNRQYPALFGFPFFALVTVLGFIASRWKAGDLLHLHEWGLGGRRFGVAVSWFLIGGDFYT